MIEPKSASGYSHQAIWSARLIRYFRSKVLLPGRGYRIHQKTNGIVIEIDQRPGGTPGTPGIRVKKFRLIAHRAEDLQCVDDSLSDTDPNFAVYVKKPELLRFSVVTRSVHGALVNYTYGTGAAGDPPGVGNSVITQRRLATSGGVSEIQVIVDSYENPTGANGDPIWAMEVTEPVPGVGGGPVTTSARFWL